MTADAITARRLTLLACILGSGMAFLDGSIVGLALPAMKSDLQAGAAGVQWIVNGYTLTLAALKPTPVQQLRTQCEARAAKRKR